MDENEFLQNECDNRKSTDSLDSTFEFLLRDEDLNSEGPPLM